MKAFYMFLALVAFAVMLCGCPAPDSEGGGNTSVTATTGGATADETAAAGETTEAGDENPLLAVELDLVPTDYAVADVDLGIGYEEYMLRHPEDANTNDMWVKEGVLGMVNVFNTQENPMPTETAVFMDGSVISFMRAEEMDPDSYAITLMDAVAAYGDYTEEPADWAKESPFFPEGYEPIEEMDASFWCDEEARVMLFYIYDPTEAINAKMLLYVDHHYAAADATFEEMNRQMEEMMTKQMEGMPTEGTEGEMPFTIKEEPVDVDAEIEAAEDEAADDVDDTETE